MKISIIDSKLATEVMRENLEAVRHHAVEQEGVEYCKKIRKITKAMINPGLIFIQCAK